MASTRTLEAIAKLGETTEGLTTFKGLPRKDGEANAERNTARMMGIGKSTRYTPVFRPFDFLSSPNQRVTLVDNQFHRIGVESVFGVQDAFHRYVDSDMVYFQFAGQTTLETEMGIFEVHPGEVVLIPGGTAQRSIGTADSLRFFCESNEMIDHIMGEDQYTSDTTFKLQRMGGPDWELSSEAGNATRGVVMERMHVWDDGPDDFTILERDYDNLVGVASPTGGGVGVVTRHAFDHFRGIVGQGGGGTPMATQPLYEAPHMRVRTYNIEGAQNGFHRGLRTEEFRIQFRGECVDLIELGNVDMRPGDVSIIPRGISHSVITDPPDDQSFLRLNFYSSVPWRVATDLTGHVYNSSFNVETTVHKEAEWRLARAAAKR